MVLTDLAYRRITRLAKEGMALRLERRQRLHRLSPIACPRCGHRPELGEVGSAQQCPICHGIVED